MKKTIGIITAACIATSSLCAEGDIAQYKSDTEILWLNAAGKREGIYDAVSLSMLGWGFVLIAIMGAVACTVHQSKAP